MVKKILCDFIKNQKASLPSLKDLELVRRKIKSIRNRKGEFLRKTHYGCYLLCLEGGLRISEAVKFDLKAKTQKGLYRIKKPKGKKERLVYISKEVIRELKKSNWKPNQTNRWNFYHFLQKIKQKANINQNIELTPHNLRRAFATYHAETGLPLPLLQKLLGHSSIRTTALYWQNIYGKDEVRDILTGKKWLEKPKTKPPLEISEPLIKRNLPKQFPKNPDSDTLRDKPVITAEKPKNKDNSLLIAETEPKLTIDSYQPRKLISEIPTKNHREFSLTSEPLPVIAKREQITEKEQILLTRIKELERNLAEASQSKNELKEKLVQVQNENKNLTAKLGWTKTIAKSEKERANYYEQQLKVIIKSLYQWQKSNHYKHLEQEQEAKVEQPTKPPNFRK